MIFQSRRPFHAADRAIALMPLERPPVDGEHNRWIAGGVLLAFILASIIYLGVAL